MKKERIYRLLQIFLKIALVVTTLIYPLFMDMMTAGLNSGSWRRWWRWVPC